jgi:hypothetical protein
VRCRILAERNALDAAARRVEAAGDAGLLPSKPDLALGRDGDVMG